MSMALTHFVFGATIVVAGIGVLLRREATPIEVVSGGIWGMIPDLHWMLSGTPSEVFRAVHDSVAANLFAAHGILDAVDTTDAHLSASLAIAGFIVVSVGVSLAASRE